MKNKIETTKITFFTLFLFTMISCTPSKNISINNFNGIYINSGDQNEKLILKENSFLQIREDKKRDLALFKCCDTLSYGNIEYSSKDFLLTLTSVKYLNDEFLNFNVEESQVINQDSVKFIFTNPIENHYKRFNESYRELLYSVEIVNSDFQDIISDKNPIVISSDNEIKEFQIKIYPKYDIPLYQLETREVKLKTYKVVNSKANVFKINIPKLDYGYFSFKRLKGDYIKVVNENKLIWDGKTYIRK